MTMSKENEEGWEDVPLRDAITYDDVVYAGLPECECDVCSCVPDEYVTLSERADAVYKERQAKGNDV